MKAVIPAAGLGTRMRSLTGRLPKEMLPVGSKPMMQHVLEEAALAGIREICIVIREGKEVIRDFFKQLPQGCELTFIYQHQPLGLGDALLQARDFVGNDSFVMMIPDQLIAAAVPATAQLLAHWRPGPFIWSSLLRLNKADRPFFIGARGVEYEQSGLDEVTIKRLRTEEETRRVYRDLDYEVRGFGRTIFPPQIFEYLGKDFINPQTGEVDLLKTFEKSRGVFTNYGIWLEGEPFDLGTFRSYCHYLPKLQEIELRQAARFEPQAEL